MSLQKIKVSKSELLGIVKDNKKKHDEIYEAAEAGYWLDAEDFLKKHLKEQAAVYKKNYLKQIKDFKKQISKELKMVEEKKRGDYWHMRKPFPENHTDDYKGTIKKLELCVEPEIELENSEFDCFVQNKWQWRQSFVSTNFGYANNSVSASFSLNSTPLAVSGSGYFGTGSLSLVNSLNNF